MKFSMSGKLFDLFESMMERAGALLKNPRRLLRVLRESEDKIETLGLGPIRNVLDDLKTLMRMVKAYITGEYTEVPWKSIVLVMAAVLYFWDPIDFIPDMVPVAGYMDDAWVIGWVVRKIREDIERFREWEEGDDEEEELQELPLDDGLPGFMNVRKLKQQLAKHPTSKSLELKSSSVHDSEFREYIFRWDFPEEFPDGIWTVVGEIVRYSERPDTESLHSRFEEFEDWLVEHDDWYYWQGDSSLVVQLEGQDSVIRVYRGARSDNIITRTIAL